MAAMLKQITLAIILASSPLTLAQEPTKPQSPTLKFSTPAGWVEEKTSSTMRIAQYKLPKRRAISKMLPWSSITSDKDKVAAQLPMLSVGLVK